MFSQRPPKAKRTGKKRECRPRRQGQATPDRQGSAQVTWAAPANWRDADGNPGVPGPGNAVIFEKR